MVPPVRDYGFFCRARRARTGGKTRVYLFDYFFFHHKIDRFYLKMSIRDGVVAVLSFARYKI